MLQDSMHLSPEQEEQILCSCESMHRMLVKCAEERNATILPELGRAGVSYSKVGLMDSAGGGGARLSAPLLF